MKALIATVLISLAVGCNAPPTPNHEEARTNRMTDMEFIQAYENPVRGNIEHQKKWRRLVGEVTGIKKFDDGIFLEFNGKGRKRALAHFSDVKDIAEFDVGDYAVLHCRVRGVGNGDIAVILDFCQKAVD